ncbi:MAG: N(4)-(beta-N-acetylglucosaminyl)-L-asparaginase [Bacteroidota bacterium]|jgi:N4-(beta-N-acetylglucosaminyl)-L-asparaginase
MKRRNFIFDIFTIGLASFFSNKLKAKDLNFSPMVRSISTWKTTEANLKSGKLLDNGYNSLDAAVQGVAVEEENPKNTTVGYGGAPDRTGKVTLDACVMNHLGDCGSVVAVENIVNVARLAKDVMEKTPHVMLAGKGAEDFAISQGYKKINLLTDDSKRAWKEWLENQEYRPIINIENHDTIGMLCMDKNNNISGACTTSGLAYKMNGRVGDSPIIGSGLFIDNKVGGAVATGLGEEVVKTVGSFLVVELMRQGYTPQEACEEAINRIVTSNSQKNKFQVAYIAMNKKGEVGSFSIEPGFTYMDYNNGLNTEVKSGSAL